DDPERAVVVGHRLMARWRRVQDGKTACPEPHRTVHVQTRIVGTAVDEVVSHPPDQRVRYRRAVGAQDAYDPTHRSTSVRASCRVIISTPSVQKKRIARGLKAAISAPYMPAPRMLKLTSVIAVGSAPAKRSLAATIPTPMASVAASGPTIAVTTWPMGISRAASVLYEITQKAGL